METNTFISYQTNQPSYPLFKLEFLKDVQIEDLPLNIIFPRNHSESFGDIIEKKTKVEEDIQAAPKKKGRKPIAKNAKQWDDPNTTIKEIIENDLAGSPTQGEIQKNEERVRKIKETKALKKAQREKGTTMVAPQENVESQVNNTLNLGLVPLIGDTQFSFAPQIIFKDGKIIVGNTQEEERKKELVVVDNKKAYKLTSMSFRPKNHTARWTTEETRKFYKAIEIFGADFSLIAKLFPTRTRDQIKNKFRKEEKANVKKMDDAFNKNRILYKRSLMDRIRAFNNNIKSGEFAALTNNEVGDELGGFDNLERRLSTASTDSMDMRIMEEIQDIFVKEIRPGNNFMTSFASTENNVTGGGLGHLDLNLDFVKEAVNETKTVGRETGVTQEGVKVAEGDTGKKQNLLMRFMN